MKILVTGAAGAIGSHVAEAFRKLGHEVVGLDCLTDYYSTDIKKITVGDLQKAGCSFHQLDLAKDNLADVVKDVDVIFHFAAQPGIAAHVPFDLYVRNNITATHRLLEAVKKNNPSLKLFVNISTSSVYGAHADGDEETIPKPISLYGVTKLAAEQLALSYYREYDIPVVSLRLFSVYGERERSDKLYHKLIEHILQDIPFPLHEGSEYHRRSYTHVSDIVGACVKLIEKADEIKGEIFNIGTDETITTGEGIKIVEDLLGKKAKIQNIPRRTGDQFKTSANIGKAKRIIEYNPTMKPEEGLKRQVEWHRNKLNKKNV